jgi:hypothetical protein
VRVTSPLRKQDGATLVIVAISLLALLGMSAIVVDMGNLLGGRRRIVQAADSAAHAAALSCGMGLGQTNADATVVEYATANAGNAQLVEGYPFYDPSCDAPFGRVTVELTAEEQQYFAPALGEGSTGTVRWRATALWGAAAGGAGMMPFMLSGGQLSSCEIPPPDPDAAVGQQCRFAFNNNDIGNAQWGRLDFDQWDVSSSDQCTGVTPVEQIGWIDNGSPLLSLNYPAPTYVCAGNGLATPVWQKLATLAGQTRQFPVSDPTGATGPGHGPVDANGALCLSPCSPDKYDIVGFAELKIISVLRGNQGGAAACPGLPSDPNSWCLTTEWVGYSTTAGTEPVDAPNFGVVAVRLDA